MKKFLNESDKKKIISEKEKTIIESFAKTFNKIKRIDENEIKENEDTKNLSPEEQKVLNDILGNTNEINEGAFDSMLDKVKSYATKGMLTAGILSALLGTPNITQAQQSQIKQAAKTEMSTQNSPFESKEWKEIKKTGASTNSKLLRFKDYHGNYQESLNWGKYKTKGYTNGFAIGIENGKIDFIIGSEDDANIVKMNSIIEKVGLGNYKKDNYGATKMDLYDNIPLKDYQLVIKAINMLSPIVNAQN
jgi:hypothetical protein